MLTTITSENHNTMLKHRIYPPVNWFDFEELCLKLWGQLWKIPNEIDFNSTNSQGQDGVDIYGIPKGHKNYYGIQCKNFQEIKKSGEKNKITKRIIDSEIENAERFQPSLEHYIIATTLGKDKEIEEYVRKINKQRIADNKFTIQICFWDYITQALYDHIDVYNWYYNNQNLSNGKKVSISFNKKDNPFTIEHYPTYLKVQKIYRLETKEDIEKDKKLSRDAFSNFQDTFKTPLFTRILDRLFRRKISDKILSNKILINGIDITSEEYKKSQYPKKITDYSDIKFSLKSIADDLCPVSFTILIENIGESVIEDYKLRMFFEGDFVNIDTRTPKYSEILSKTYKHDVFINDKSCHIQPENNFLVQKDYFISEKITLIPKKAFNTEIKIKWEFIGRDYNDKGELSIYLKPKFENKTEEFLVLNNDECRIEEETRYKTYEYMPTLKI